MRVERVAIAGLELDLERPVDPEQLLDEEAFASDEFLPYWAELWPSGVALAEHVGRLELIGKRVLELGCGLGLPALVAAARGADVTATDWAADAIALLERNASRNRLAVATHVADWRAPQLGRFDLALAADVLYEERNVAPLVSALHACLTIEGEAIVADPGRRHLPAFLERAESAFAVVTEPGTWTSGAVLVRLERRAAL